MTRRCCGEIRGVSQPVVRFAGVGWRARGSMLAVEEERRERAGGVVSLGGWRVGVGWGGDGLLSATEWTRVIFGDVERWW